MASTSVPASPAPVEAYVETSTTPIPSTTFEQSELPTCYDAAAPNLDRRKSTTSIRRKPVPHPSENADFDLSKLPRHDSTTTTEARTSLDPPTYILEIAPPRPAARSLHYPYPDNALSIRIDTSESGPTDDLPCYAEENQTEPATLARGLWRWGWVCPLLWALGMCILWIPLKPIDEESDPDKAQKLDEMIVILRKTELRYARRCLWGFLGFFGMILGVSLVAVVVSIETRGGR